MSARFLKNSVLRGVSSLREQPEILILAAGGIAAGLLLARLPLLMAAAGTLVGLALLASLWEPLAGVALVLFFAPFWAWLRAEVPEVPAQIGQLLFAITLGSWLLRKVWRREWSLAAPPLLGALAVFLSAALLSLWNPVDVWTGFTEWAKWGQVLLMFWLVYDECSRGRSDQRVRAVLAALLVAGLFQAGMGLWQFGLRGTGPAHFAINERFYRAYGTFEQPNPYGGFLSMLGAVAVGLVLAGGGDWVWSRIQGRRPVFPRWAWVVGLVALPLVGALLASWSRGGWLGFGAALLVMALALPRRRGWGLLLVVVAIVGGLLLYQSGALPASITSRLTGFLDYTRFEDVRGVGINDANYAVLERMAHWQAALGMWQDNFWTGVGFGCYEPAYPRYALINWPIALGHAHNYYLNLLAETGLIGLAAYLFWLGAIFKGLEKAVRRLAGWERGLALGLIGAWTQLVVHDLVDNLLVNNIHLHVAVLLALSAWVISRARQFDLKRET